MVFEGRLFNSFIKDKVAFLSWTDKDAPELHKLFRHIKIGDILYIKSYNPTSGLTIKAIGLVTDNTMNQGNNNSISVGWIWEGKKDAEKHEDRFIVLEPNMDKYNVRNIAVYEEFTQKNSSRLASGSIPKKPSVSQDKALFLFSWNMNMFINVIIIHYYFIT